MEGYYFDIETYSQGEFPDVKTDKIITIQFQKINLKTGKTLGDLQILREWEDGEEEMLRLVYKFFFKRNPWQFIPIGFNLIFEWKFLSEKFKEYGIDDKNLSYYFDTFPQIDLKFLAVLKQGSFKGASLSSISDKKDNGNVIKDYYENKEYSKINAYIENEAESFLEMYSKIVSNIDKLF
ncbi:MAG: hypothetical protein KC589_05355 [Nanoarchaeota archaeon]|nr:hypothetical protein [Nanoarchaeota archaeon]